MLRSRFAGQLSRILVLIGGTVLGVVLLVVLIRSVSLDQLAAAFSNVDYRYMALAVIPFLINLIVKIPRWALLYGDEAPDWDTLFGAMNVGYAVNALLPARLGELVRAYWVRDRAGISMVRTLSTIALERVSDGLTLIVFLLVLAPTVAMPTWLLRSSLTLGVIFGTVLLGMVVLAYLSAFHEQHVQRLVDLLESSRVPFVGKVLVEITIGLQALRSRSAVVLLVFYTFVIWSSNALLIWLVLRAFHIEVPFAAAFLLTAVLNLGMAVPSSPGYVGVFDFLMVFTLGLYGVPRTQALAADLAIHTIAFVPVTIIGLFYIARRGSQVVLQMLRASVTQPGEGPEALA